MSFSFSSKVPISYISMQVIGSIFFTEFHSNVQSIFNH